jgi:hypothetical protein
MKFLVWIANQALWISLIGVVCAIVVRFEKSLPKRLHKLLLVTSIFITIATPLLGLLKKSLDDQWKAEMQRQVSAAIKASQQKPFKERLIDLLNSIDKTIVPRLAAGQTKFPRMYFSPVQFTDLQRLAAEPGADAYITLHPGPTVWSNVTSLFCGDFELSPFLLKP